MSRAIAAFASRLKISYPTAVGLIVLLNELDVSNELDGMSDEIFWMNLGGKQRFTKDCLLDNYRDISEGMKRERERDRKRDYRAKLSQEMSHEEGDKTDELSREMSHEEGDKRERESVPLVSPSPVPLTPIIPFERERERGTTPAEPSFTDVQDGSAAPGRGRRTRKRTVFTKPTLEEVRDYCQERNNGINPQHFLDHYDANGWVVGKAKAPMKDWKAAIRTWEHRQDNAAVPQKNTTRPKPVIRYMDEDNPEGRDNG